MKSTPRAGGAARVLVLGALLVLLGGFAGCGSTRSPATVDAAGGQEDYRGTELDGLYRLPDVTLTDGSDDAYNLATSPSRPVTLVFFGYTHCPDVCPAVLSNVAVALQRSPEQVRQRTQLIFISTDPARDTPAVNAAYLARFDPTFIGLTGELGTIKRVAGGMGVDIGGTTKLPGGGYEVTHSTPVIGFDKAGAAQVLWDEGTPTADLGADLALLVSRQ